MKKIILLVIVCLLLVGCTDRIDINPYDYETAVKACESNQGLKYFKYEDDNFMQNNSLLQVVCKDNATFTFKYRYGVTGEHIVDYGKYHWKGVTK